LRRTDLPRIERDSREFGWSQVGGSTFTTWCPDRGRGQHAAVGRAVRL